MKAAITGASGFVGSNLQDFLIRELKVTTVPVARSLLYGKPEQLARHLAGCSVVIHLSGANILSRWTKKRKKLLWESRITTTKNLVKAFTIMNDPPKTFISTSATGIYNNIGFHDEGSRDFSNDFLGSLALKWEEEATLADKIGIRTIIFRFGMVLGRNGGALRKMLPAFQVGLGAIIGTGEQGFPFIHLADLKAAYVHVIQKTNCQGVYNLVAPEIISNREFSNALAIALHCPLWFTIPAWTLTLLFGEGAKMLCHGQKVIPKRLPESGFAYRYATIRDAVQELLG